jgi:hypothetical protein
MLAREFEPVWLPSILHVVLVGAGSLWPYHEPKKLWFVIKYFQCESILKQEDKGYSLESDFLQCFVLKYLNTIHYHVYCVAQHYTGRQDDDT